jgi:hypothetical protein
MGQRKLSPPDNGLFPRGARRLRADAHCHLSGAVAPSPTTQHFVPHAQSFAPSGDQRFAKQAPPVSSLRTPPSGMRKLDAVLLLVATLPSLTFGVMFWLGVISVPWPTAMDVFARAIQSASVPAGLALENPQPQPAAQIPPVLTAPAILEAKAGQDLTFAIALDGTDGVPARSIIAISGLPHGTTFSSGLPYGETEWNLKPDEIGDLHVVPPNTASGESKLGIQLLAPDGDVIAGTETLLKVAADGDGAPALQRIYDPKLVGFGASGIKPEPTQVQAWHEPVQELERMGAEAKIAGPEVAPATSGGAAQLLPSDPTPVANDDGRSWIVLLAFVNLREGPSSSSRVIGEMPKGAKLRALDRERGWVQVTDSATSATGWVYAENIAAASNSARRPMRAVRSRVRSGSDDSPWTGLSQWLAGP